MSTKQMARAAADERLVIVWFSDTETLRGFLVGMDDFHWLLAHVEGRSVCTTLVHKTAPRIQIGRKTLDDLGYEAHLVDEIRSIGQSFFNYCRTTILGQAKVDK